MSQTFYDDESNITLNLLWFLLVDGGEVCCQNRKTSTQDKPTPVFHQQSSRAPKFQMEEQMAPKGEEDVHMCQLGMSLRVDKSLNRHFYFLN